MKIVCFGDSNTFGYDSETKGRFSEDIRWCGILRKSLGENVNLIERGLNGRTVAFEDDFIPGRNGMDATDKEIFSECPVDLLVVMLGTNDCKTAYNADENTIGNNMDKMIERFLHNKEIHEILLLSPVPMNGNCSKGFMGFGEQSAGISAGLASEYSNIARKHNIRFADAGVWEIELTSDGCHYTEDGHRQFADKIYKIINEITKGR